MRINIKNRTRRLETIHKEDVLIFPDREETVEEVDRLTGNLYIERTIPNIDRNSPISPEDFPIKVEKVAYRGIDRITPFSQRRIYDWEKRRAA